MVDRRTLVEGRRRKQQVAAIGTTVARGCFGGFLVGSIFRFRSRSSKGGRGWSRSEETHQVVGGYDGFRGLNGEKEWEGQQLVFRRASIDGEGVETGAGGCCHRLRWGGGNTILSWSMGEKKHHLCSCCWGKKKDECEFLATVTAIPWGVCFMLDRKGKGRSKGGAVVLMGRWKTRERMFLVWIHAEKKNECCVCLGWINVLNNSRGLTLQQRRTLNFSEPWRVTVFVRRDLRR